MRTRVASGTSFGGVPGSHRRQSKPFLYLPMGGGTRALESEFHVNSKQERGSGPRAHKWPISVPGDQRIPSGASRDRTGDLLLAKQALSQLSYGPETTMDNIVSA